jgi:hypothetical protein
MQCTRLEHLHHLHIEYTNHILIRTYKPLISFLELYSYVTSTCLGVRKIIKLKGMVDIHGVIKCNFLDM